MVRQPGIEPLRAHGKEEPGHDDVDRDWHQRQDRPGDGQARKKQAEECIETLFEAGLIFCLFHICYRRGR